ncbi:MAG: SET domain-containing protein-lysine N-methyltransferase [Candidatus Acidiferrales bacterium]
MKTPGAKKTPRINPKAADYQLRVTRSPLHRYGVFALEDIPAGRRVIEYTGKRLDRAQAATIKPPKDIYLAGVNPRLAIDGSKGGSGAQFINHSCSPNLTWRAVRNRLLFFSRRKIRAGEELTVNYRYPIRLERVPCHCGARRCRGTLRFILR